MKRVSYHTKKKYAGLIFVSPWALGFLLLTVFPMVFALYVSFTDWSIGGTPTYVGLANFKEILTNDREFKNALYVTVRYAVFAVPLTIGTAFTIAALLTTKIKAIGVFRTIYYMPAIVSGVAVAVVWKWMFDEYSGPINGFLGLIGVHGPSWLYDPNYVLPSYLVMAIWGAGGGMLTYLVGLKDIPRELYEAASIDGASFMQKVRMITMPLMTPILFYNLIMGIISAFRKFSDAIIVGGIDGQADFYMVYLFRKAFDFGDMGYATALAWILFIIIFTLTIIINVTKKYWVYEN